MAGRPFAVAEPSSDPRNLSLSDTFFSPDLGRAGAMGCARGEVVLAFEAAVTMTRVVVAFEMALGEVAAERGILEALTGLCFGGEV